jgi:hypothetical protein
MGCFAPSIGSRTKNFVELINRTVHAAAVSVLVETANSYRFYFAVYISSVGRLTGGNRPVPKTDRVPVAAGQRARELGPNDGSPSRLISWWLRRSRTLTSPIFHHADSASKHSSAH